MKRLGMATAIALASCAAQAGTVFEVPINGGTARIQLDDNREGSMCASLSWTDNDRHQDRKESTRKDTAKPTTKLETEPVTKPTQPAPGSIPGTSVSSRPAPDPAGTSPAGNGAAGEQPAMASGEPDEKPAASVSEPVAKPARTAAVKAPATSPVGEWLVEDGDARIRIEECGSNLCGVVSAAKNANDTDRKNPNPELRNRPIIGMPVLLDMKPGKSNRWEGRIYNANDGQTYTANISLNDPQRLRVEGCKFGGFLCGGQNWTRVN